MRIPHLQEEAAQPTQEQEKEADEADLGQGKALQGTVEADMEPLKYLVVRYSNGEVGWGPRGLDTHDEEGPNTSETVDATPLDQAAATGKKGSSRPTPLGMARANWWNRAPEPLPSTQAGPSPRGRSEMLHTSIITMMLIKYNNK